MDVEKVYTRSLSNPACKPLPHAEQRRLIKLAQQGDTEARNRLVMSMMRFVSQIARKYLRPGNPPLLDLVQIGSLGVMRAVEKFDLASNTSFSTYVRRAIRDKIGRACKGDKLGTAQLTTRNVPAIVDEESPDQQLSAKEARKRAIKDVRQAIEGLPSRQRRVMKARLKGYSQTKIGRVMGTSQPRVSKIEAKARESLRSSLGHLQDAI